MLHIAFVVSEPDSIEPFGVMSLVPHLTAAGHTCRLFCAEATDLIPALTSFAPQLVCYSSTSGAHTYLAEVNRALKESLSFISVFGGPHPTFFPDFIHEEGVDVIARGECDHSFALFCQGVVDHGHPVETPNFSIKTTRGISSSPVAPLIQDLDSLPFPDRESYYSLSPKIRGYTVRSFLASRGCPFSCSYCFNHSMDALYDGCFRRPRVRSPGSLIAEIREVIGRYPTEFLAFRESIFPLNTAWLITFARLMREHVRLPFYCHLRLDMVTPKRVALLREAGCHSVNVGIEAGSESIRRDLLGRDMSDETIIEGCRLLREAGIHILANNMLGLPSTTFAQDLATLRLNQRAKPHYS
ncbi:radical SAM protein, partial [Myxococcota bacterium]|nr:radical SAM protein [Myxococcota bacterium]